MAAKVKVTGTFTFTVLMREPELGVSVAEEGLHALLVELDKRYGGYDDVVFLDSEACTPEVLDYGEFAEPQTCPNCLEVYYKGYKTAYIKVHGVCEDCPDPELEELE